MTIARPESLPHDRRTAGRGSIAALGLVLAPLWVMGCKRAEPSAPPPPASASAVAVQRGETIVVEQAAAVFAEARVLEVQGARLRVEAPDDAESPWLEQRDVYRLGSDARPPATGALAICRAAPTKWLPCRIERTEASHVSARDAAGKALALSPADVLTPRPVTELNLKRFFERTTEERTFLDHYREAGQPPRQPRWLPAPHARVLARRDGQWYSAEIHEFDEDVPRVKFGIDERITEVPVAELAPEPPYDVSALRRGDFVMVRPPGNAEPWRPAEIRSLGDREFRVADVSGTVRTVSARDVVPLVHADVGEGGADVNADR